jgi:hypothetical protein
VQPGAQREAVLQVAAFFAPEGGVGDEGVDLAHAGADVVEGRANCAGHEAARAIELDAAADLAADEGVEVEVGRFAGAEVQAVGGLEQQLVGEEAVDAFVAGEAHRLQCGRTQEKRDGFALDALSKACTSATNSLNDRYGSAWWYGGCASGRRVLARTKVASSPLKLRSRP